MKPSEDVASNEEESVAHAEASTAQMTMQLVREMQKRADEDRAEMRARFDSLLLLLRPSVLTIVSGIYRV